MLPKEVVKEGLRCPDQPDGSTMRGALSGGCFMCNSEGFRFSFVKFIEGCPFCPECYPKMVAVIEADAKLKEIEKKRPWWPCDNCGHVNFGIGGKCGNCGVVERES